MARHFLPLIQLRVVGGLESIPAVIGPIQKCVCIYMNESGRNDIFFMVSLYVLHLLHEILYPCRQKTHCNTDPLLKKQ